MRYDPDNDAYAILNVRPDASREEVEAAFRKSVLLWHPDKCPSPDAPELFQKVQNAAKCVRDPQARREYDRLRAAHSKAPPLVRPRYEAPAPYVPLADTPAWLTASARIVHDGILFPIVGETRSMVSELMAIVIVLSLGAIAFTADLTFALLALVAYSVLRVDDQEPRRWKSAWLKVVPGRRQAEYSKLDQGAGIFVRYEVPYGALQVAVTQHRNRFSVEIRGFPQGSVTLLERTRDLAFARRCAREAGTWLDLPVARAA